MAYRWIVPLHNRNVSAWLYFVEWLNEWLNEWMKQCMREGMFELPNDWMIEWLHGWMTEWTNAWMKEWMNEQMAEWSDECVDQLMLEKLLLITVFEYFPSWTWPGFDALGSISLQIQRVRIPLRRLPERRFSWQNCKETHSDREVFPSGNMEGNRSRKHHLDSKEECGLLRLLLASEPNIHIGLPKSSKTTRKCLGYSHVVARLPNHPSRSLYSVSLTDNMKEHIPLQHVTGSAVRKDEILMAFLSINCIFG